MDQQQTERSTLLSKDSNDTNYSNDTNDTSNGTSSIATATPIATPTTSTTLLEKLQRAIAGVVTASSSSSSSGRGNNYISAQQLFFPPSNPSVQGYYRFTASKLTPFAVLHTQPEDGPLHTPSSSTTFSTNTNLTQAGGGNNVTGLLRRSAVLPSHGIDPSGRWVLVSVGGRSGWARREVLTPLMNGKGTTTMTTNPSGRKGSHRGDLPMSQQQQQQQQNNGSPVGTLGGHDPNNIVPKAAFHPARMFRASEGWMGNHIFLCHGKIMLGSDAPLFFVTNFLIVGFFLLHFYVLLPHLYNVEIQQMDGSNTTLSANYEHVTPTYLSWTTHSITVWFTSLLAITSMIFLWLAASMDPGILPPISSPVRTPVPEGDEISIGGPLGYKYCSTCNIFRPPRSKHCNSCNVCVSQFDQ